VKRTTYINIILMQVVHTYYCYYHYC